jgi:hypothetical protein
VAGGDPSLDHQPDHESDAWAVLPAWQRLIRLTGSQRLPGRDGPAGPGPGPRPLAAGPAPSPVPVALGSESGGRQNFKFNPIHHGMTVTVISRRSVWARLPSHPSLGFR